LYTKKVYYMNKIYNKMRRSLPSICEIEMNRNNVDSFAAKLK